MQGLGVLRPDPTQLRDGKVGELRETTGHGPRLRAGRDQACAQRGIRPNAARGAGQASHCSQRRWG
jgi:hypothetical protein